MGASLIAVSYTHLDVYKRQVGIIDVIGDSYEEAKEEGAVMVWMQMLYWAILLSANLGVMNLLPIPALDGGRLVFLLIEAVRKKRLNPNVEGMIHFAGFMLLMLLMVFVLSLIHILVWNRHLAVLLQIWEPCCSGCFWW